MLFIPVFLISWFLRKTRFQFDLVMILSGICAYGAYTADLMTKSTPNWGALRSNIPFIIGFIIIGLVNIISVLHITIYFTKKRVLNPIYQAIKEKSEIEKSLRQQKRELSNFAHMMAHDLRSNLTSIKGYAEMITIGLGTEGAQIIKDKIQQIQNLLESSVDLADAGKIIDKAELVDLNNLVAKVSETIIPKHINVKIEGLPEVYADRHRLYQVLKNILENAVIHGKPKEIKLTSDLSDSSSFIIIENDGKPISGDIIEKFQDSNYSIDFNLRGLGLKIVKRIIEAHNWKITIKNNPITTFIIIIPKYNQKIS
ncbi:MAG: sensor histidine kinase [Candidatus Hermodarchaeota archaeon]